MNLLLTALWPLTTKAANATPSVMPVRVRLRFFRAALSINVLPSIHTAALSRKVNESSKPKQPQNIDPALATHRKNPRLSQSDYPTLASIQVYPS
mmetsp:Transcript_17757/g.54631  ORF Transcript_17757/g.54631 Transcript_17757/m.54631 type:complete len:95 (-) Transcript_17757:50-334(-)